MLKSDTIRSESMSCSYHKFQCWTKRLRLRPSDPFFGTITRVKEMSCWQKSVMFPIPRLSFTLQSVTSLLDECPSRPSHDFRVLHLNEMFRNSFWHCSTKDDDEWFTSRFREMPTFCTVTLLRISDRTIFDNKISKHCNFCCHNYTWRYGVILWIEPENIL